MNPSQETTLILYEGVFGTSPFGSWMELLQRRLGDDVETMSGTFTRFPLATVVIDGLLIVHRALAQRYEHLLTSADQVLSEMSPYVNRLVNTGLVLRYGTLKEAADAFEREVMEPILHGDLTWAVLAAKYFAALVKTAREASEQLDRIERDVEAIERSEARLAGAQLLDSEVLHTLSRYARDLAFRPSRIAGRGSAAQSDASEAFVAEIIKKKLVMMEDIQVRVRLMLALPFDLRPVREQVLLIGRGTTRASVEQHWLETQLWLTLLDAPVSQQLLKYRELVLALSRREGVSDDALVERFFERMIARGATLSASDRDALEARLHHRLIPQLRRRPIQVSNKEAYELFLDVSLDDLVATEEMALEALTGDARQIMVGLEAQALNNPDGLYEGLLDRVNWEELNFKQIRDLVVRGMVKLSHLVDRFSLLDKGVIKRLAQWMLKQDLLTLNAVTVFENALVLTVDMDFFLAHPEITPLEMREGFARGLLFGYVQKNPTVMAATGLALVRALAAVPEQVLRKIAGDVQERKRFVMFLDHLIYEEKVYDTAEFVALRDALEPELFAFLVLSEEIRMRWTRYTTERSDPDYGVFEPRWGTWRQYDLLPRLHPAFGSKDVADEAYRLHSEFEVLDWYAEGDRGSSWAEEYRRVRAAFYRRMHGRKPRCVEDDDDEDSD